MSMALLAAEAASSTDVGGVLLAGGIGFGSGLLTGIATAFVTEALVRRRERRSSDREETRLAQDVLVDLRAAYRRRATTSSDPDDSTIQELCDRWDVAASRVESDRVTRLGTTYKDVGGLYASGDPLVGVAQESKAFDRLMAQLRRELRRVL